MYTYLRLCEIETNTPTLQQSLFLKTRPPLVLPNPTRQKDGCGSDFDSQASPWRFLATLSATLAAASIFCASSSRTSPAGMNHACMCCVLFKARELML
jgi:hypothetical protein